MSQYSHPDGVNLVLSMSTFSWILSKFQNESRSFIKTLNFYFEKNNNKTADTIQWHQNFQHVYISGGEIRRFKGKPNSEQQ